jgi:glycosyltransferase involved in cell wall biosynthesis
MSNNEYITDKVTVVIPVYNEERFLRQTLESVVEQVDYVIIGDNASTDGTEAICREFAEKYEHIKYIRNESNIGNLANFNRCFPLVQTEFFFTMGGHDLVAPNFVEVTKKRLQSSEQDVAGVMTARRWIDGEGNVITENAITDTYITDTYFQKCVSGLVENDPFVRVYNYASNPFCEVFFSLYRNSKALQYFSDFPPVWNSDGVVIFNVLFKGKIIYDENTSFLCRDIHGITQKGFFTQQYREAATKRYFGQSSEVDYAPYARLILLSFKNFECEFAYEKTKEQLYYKLAGCLSHIYGLSGNPTCADNLGVTPPCKHFFTWALLRHPRKTWKKVVFWLKCQIIPGYKKRKSGANPEGKE